VLTKPKLVSLLDSPPWKLEVTLELEEVAVEEEAEEEEQTTTTELSAKEIQDKNLERLKKISHLYEQSEGFSLNTKRER